MGVITTQPSFIEIQRTIRRSPPPPKATNNIQEKKSVLFLKIVDPNSGDPVVPHFTVSSMDSSGGRNPGARVFYLDADTLIPIDYEQYRIDLNSLVGKKGCEKIP